MRNLILFKFKLVFVLFLQLFSLGVLAGETAEQENAGSIELVPLIQHLSNRFLDEKLTVDELEYELSGAAELSENKKSWYINSDKYKVRVNVSAQTKNSAINELQFYPNNTKQLNLKDIERIFGNSHAFMRSINTWVEFDSLKSKNDRRVAITAKLYSPPESEVSPVLTIKLRLE